MAVIQIPGVNGTIVANTTSSRYLRNGVGKFTAESHLHTFWKQAPMEYDKMINFYIQQELYSDDLSKIISASTPFYIEGTNDSFTYDVNKRVQYPKIIQNLADTLAKPGIDGQEFTLVFDKKVFVQGDIITSNKREQNQQIQVKSDGKDYGGGFLYTLTCHSQTPASDFVSQKWLQVNTEYFKIGNIMGEFSTKFSGLSQINDKLKVMQTLGEEFGVEHAITDWADSRTLKAPAGADGTPLDLTYFATGDPLNGKVNLNTVKWLPTIELMARAEMKRMKTNKLLWQRGGVYKDETGNLVPCGSGVWEQLHKGHVHTYNRGEFSLNMLRNIFGDLFYRRTPMSQRKVVMYTNEAGFNVFNEAAKMDAHNNGFMIIPNESNGILTGKGQQLTLSYAYDSVVTRDTGLIELKHLMELDLPQTNTEFGSNKRSAPIFLVFDMSTMTDGSMANNIREVRSKSRPSMRWGYVDGAVHHLGFAASQGMSSANKNPWYELWFKDRVGVFIEDVTRTVIIKEIPQI